MIVGDGICGSYGEGPYKIIINDELFKEGGGFGNTTSVSFSMEGEEATCEDKSLSIIRLLMFYLD